MIRRYFQNPTLRISLALLLTGLVAGTVLGLGTAAYFRARQVIREGLRDRLRDSVAIASALVDVEAHSRLRTAEDEKGADYERIRQTLRTIRARCQGVRFVYTMRELADGRFEYVVDGEEDPKLVSHLGDLYDGEVSPAMRAAFRAGSGPQVDEDFSSDSYGLWLSCYAPLATADGRVDGILGMDTAADRVIAFERSSVIAIPGITLAIGLLAAGFGIWLSRRIAEPLLLLAEDMTRVRDLKLDSGRAPRTRIRELVQMHEAVENMKGGLRSFRRYVPAELVANLIRLGKEARLGTEKTEVTLFFSDIRDFTAISEKLAPEELAANLSKYFQGVTSAIVEQHGTVDKFIGDCVMAFWGAPEPIPDHPEAACRAALEAQRFLTRQCEEWRAAGTPPLVTGIGIHTGVAMVGNVGFDGRFDYTAIGDSVNVASRIEGLNKLYDTRILISETTLAKVQHAFAARWIDRVVVVGKGSGIDIHELLGETTQITPAEAELIRLAGEARTFYMDRQWTAAAGKCQEILAVRPRDQAAAVLRERCLAFIANPPPAEWRGEFVAGHK